MTAFVCTPPGVIPEFGSRLRAEPRTIYAVLGADEPAGCATTLTGQAAIDCASFTTWTQYTAAFAGVLGTAANVVYSVLAKQNKKIADEIVTGLHAVYAGVQGINQQFLLAISCINANTPYAPIPTPEPIPPFPTPQTGSSIGQAVESAWHIFKPFLEKMIAKMAAGSPWIKVLEGMIASSDQMIAQLKTLFEQISH